MHWLTTGKVATLHWNSWLWTIDLSDPRSGLDVKHSGRGHVAQLLEIQPTPAHACEIEDSFVRGSDLMVRYGQSPSDQFAFQLDFRAVNESELGPYACGLDVWLSVQTQLLDSHPTLNVCSHADQALWSVLDVEKNPPSNEGPAVLTCENAAAAVALFIHPSDRVQAELVSQEDSTCCLRLFGNFMEKGVIRRGRLRFLISEAPVDRVALTAVYHMFADSPLPLTA